MNAADRSTFSFELPYYRLVRRLIFSFRFRLTAPNIDRSRLLRLAVDSEFTVSRSVTVLASSSSSRSTSSSLSSSSGPPPSELP
jgi:hypothetical protein